MRDQATDIPKATANGVSKGISAASAMNKGIIQAKKAVVWPDGNEGSTSGFRPILTFSSAW